jgi:hypothetical protein
MPDPNSPLAEYRTKRPDYRTKCPFFGLLVRITGQNGRIPDKTAGTPDTPDFRAIQTPLRPLSFVQNQLVGHLARDLPGKRDHGTGCDFRTLNTPHNAINNN